MTSNVLTGIVASMVSFAVTWWIADMIAQRHADKLIAAYNVSTTCAAPQLAADLERALEQLIQCKTKGKYK